MSHLPDYKRGQRDGVRRAITWLHQRALEMNDPNAKTILNTAAFNFGVDAKRHDLLPSTDRLQTRADEIGKWLGDNAPYCAADQRHMDENTPERAYWHYGYMAALLDAINQQSTQEPK